MGAAADLLVDRNKDLPTPVALAFTRPPPCPIPGIRDLIPEAYNNLGLGRFTPGSR